MRKIAATFLMFFTLICANYFVFDEAGIIPANHEQVLERIIYSWMQQTKHEMAIVTVKSLQGLSIEDYAVKQYEKLGLGKKNKDDGLLFLIAPNDHKVRVEVGYGLEPYLTDGTVGNILDQYVLPKFNKNNMVKGIETGTLALILTQAKQEGIELTDLQSGKLASKANTPQSAQGSAALGFIFIIIMLILIKRHPRLATFMVYSALFSSLGGGYRRSSFDSFGGSFGGFGGGLSGGGGASRGW